MDHNEILPTFEQFTRLVNTTNFTEEEIDFQKKIALEVGFLSWNEYLNYILIIISKSSDLNRMAEEFVNCMSSG